MQSVTSEMVTHDEEVCLKVSCYVNGEGLIVLPSKHLHIPFQGEDFV